jgi:hypothetical protein
MDRTNALVGEVDLWHAVAAHENGNFAERLEHNTIRVQLRDQLIEPTHWSPSMSATVASMAARSSLCRVTMRAISLFRSAMSTVSRVSSFST